MDQSRQQQAVKWDDDEHAGWRRSSNGQHFSKGGLVLSLLEHVLPQVWPDATDDIRGTIWAGPFSDAEFPFYVPAGEYDAQAENVNVGGVTTIELDVLVLTLPPRTDQEVSASKKKGRDNTRSDGDNARPATGQPGLPGKPRADVILYDREGNELSYSAAVKLNSHVSAATVTNARTRAGLTKHRKKSNRKGPGRKLSAEERERRSKARMKTRAITIEGEDAQYCELFAKKTGRPNTLSDLKHCYSLMQNYCASRGRDEFPLFNIDEDTVQTLREYSRTTDAVAMLPWVPKQLYDRFMALNNYREFVECLPEREEMPQMLPPATRAMENLNIADLHRYAEGYPTDVFESQTFALPDNPSRPMPADDSNTMQPPGGIFDDPRYASGGDYYPTQSRPTSGLSRVKDGFSLPLSRGPKPPKCGVLPREIPSPRGINGRSRTR